MIFYHITTPEAWAQYADKDFYEAESLHTEGFIHASFEEQVKPTLAVHFKGAGPLLLLTIDSSLLTSRLEVEASRDGALFPHIYGPLNKSAVTHIETL